MTVCFLLRNDTILYSCIKHCNSPFSIVSFTKTPVRFYWNNNTIKTKIFNRFL